MRAFHVFLGFATLAICGSTYSRESIITFLAWYPSYGTTVGCDRWRDGGFGYNRQVATATNRPLTSGTAPKSTPLSPLAYAFSPDGKEAIINDLTNIKNAGFDVVA